MITWALGVHLTGHNIEDKQWTSKINAPLSNLYIFNRGVYIVYFRVIFTDNT